MTEYSLNLTQAHIQLLMQALGELPLKVSLNTFAEIQKQVAAQDEAGAVELK